MTHKIGQILVEMGILTTWQVEQILAHQKLSRQRFGQIAVSWGWAKSRDIWEAWARQLTSGDRVVDLDDVGVDTAALEIVPPAIAWHYRVVGIRAWGENLVLAVPEHLAALAKRDLPALLGGNLHFCLADGKQIEQVLDRSYTLSML